MLRVKQAPLAGRIANCRHPCPTQSLNQATSGSGDSSHDPAASAGHDFGPTARPTSVE